MSTWETQLEKSHYKIVTGDIRLENNNMTDYIGNYSLGLRNSRGDIVADFLRSEYLYCVHLWYLLKQNLIDKSYSI